MSGYPGTMIGGPGAGMWSLRCQAALIACGIDPENFEGYEDRAEAQAKLRKAYADQRVAEAAEHAASGGARGRPHESFCPKGGSSKQPCLCCHGTDRRTQRELDAIGMQPPRERAGGWLEANAQSGHIAQNGYFQTQGGREDNCANVPPRPQRNPDGSVARNSRGQPVYQDMGSYGYDFAESLCMDHHGRSKGHGVVPAHGTHGTITTEEGALQRDQARAGAFQNDGGIPRVPMSSIETQVDGNNQLAVTAGRQHPRAGVVTDDERRSEVHDVRRQQLARQLRGTAVHRGDAALAAEVDGFTAASPNGLSPTPEAEDVARQCIKDKWKESLEEMRSDAINNRSTVGQYINRVNEQRAKDGLPPLPPFTEMSPRQQADFLRYSQTDQAQRTLAAQGANSGAQGTPAPTQAQCMEYQGNFLAQQMQQNGGTLPIDTPPGQMSGRLPGSMPSGGPAPGPAVGTGSGASFP